MQAIRDRIIEFRRVRAGELQPHPQNWRRHPTAQRAALGDVLREIGYAGALVARRLADGRLELIDGHLRAETTPEAEVPVLVVDLDEREAALLLAVHDPLAAMAEPDAALLQTLLHSVDADRIDVDRILGELLHPCEANNGEDAGRPAAEPQLTDLFQVLVECRDEAEQRTVFERLTHDGIRCRVLTL